MIESYKYFSTKLYLVLIYLILSITVLLSGAFLLQQEAYNSFDRAVYNMNLNMTERMEHFMDVLYTFRGFFYTQSEVSQTQWDIFNNSFNAGQRYDFQSELGFIQILNDSEIKDRNLYKSLSNRDEHFIVKYHSGHGVGESAVGIDISSEENRYQALSWARDNARVVSIPPLELFGRKNVTGIILFLPIYKPSEELETIEQRREHISGFISYIIPVSEFIGELVSPKSIDTLKFRITDVESNSIIYKNCESIENNFNVLTKKINLRFGNRDWIIEYFDVRSNYLHLSHVLLIFVGSVATFNAFIHLLLYISLKKRTNSNSNS